MIPYLRESKQKREIIDVFGGYNANLRIKEGEWSNMERITLDHYPVFAPEMRVVNAYNSKFDYFQCERNYVGLGLLRLTKSYKRMDMYTSKKIIMCTLEKDGTELIIEMEDDILDPDELHGIVPFGACAIIMPELYYINLSNGTVEGNKYVTSDRGFIISSCLYEKNGGTISGKTFIPVSAQFADFEQEDEPASAQIGQRWRKTTDGRLYELRKKEWRYQQTIDYVQSAEPSPETEGQLWLNTNDKKLYLWHSTGEDDEFEYLYTVDYYASSLPKTMSNGQKAVNSKKGLYVAETEWIEKTNDEINSIIYVDALPDIEEKSKRWVCPAHGSQGNNEYYIYTVEKGWKFENTVFACQVDEPQDASNGDYWYNTGDGKLYIFYSDDPGWREEIAAVDYYQETKPFLPDMKGYYSVKNKAEIYRIIKENGEAYWSEVSGAYTRINISGDATETKVSLLAEGMQVYVTSVVNGSETDLGERIMKDEKTVKGGLYLAYGITELKLECKPPIMDFMFESGNRMWGCRYGTNHHGEFVNEIYASALGDFKNWSKFAGVSTDSFIASIGTDGPFTGACNYLGYPIFFKEDCVHKVYGAYPAQYQVQTTMCPGMGVENGAAKTLKLCERLLYYKGKNGVFAYDGNYPSALINVWGEEILKYSGEIAGSCRGKYHLTMDKGNGSETFVYYPRLQKWTRLENMMHSPTEWFERDGLLECPDGKFLTTLYGDSMYGGALWSATSGIWQITSPDKKYVSKLTLRMTLPTTSTFKAEIEYDSSGEWKTIVEDLHGNGLASFNLPILPRRCDHLRLRISGKGDCKIYSITKTIEEGSDV